MKTVGQDAVKDGYQRATVGAICAVKLPDGRFVKKRDAAYNSPRVWLLAAWQ